MGCMMSELVCGTLERICDDRASIGGVFMSYGSVMKEWIDMSVESAMTEWPSSKMDVETDEDMALWIRCVSDLLHSIGYDVSDLERFRRGDGHEQLIVRIGIEDHIDVIVIMERNDDGDPVVTLQAMVYGDESGYVQFDPYSPYANAIYINGWITGMLRYLSMKRDMLSA